MNRITSRKLALILLALSLILLLPAYRASASDANPTSGMTVIPKPLRIDPGDGYFHLGADCTIRGDVGAGPEARQLGDALMLSLGRTIDVVDNDQGTTGRSEIRLHLNEQATQLGPEGYQLRVTRDLITATALKPAGLFYACQTLRQLVAPAPSATVGAAGGGITIPPTTWAIPAVVIEDIPRFSWRGLLLDVGRHHFPLDDLKHFVDIMAYHKLNRFQIHMTDDQGWRPEIKRYPRLTEVGAWRTRSDGTRYGGYYTREQFRELVEYAAQRHVVIVPEIEMPGHSLGALTAYPHLGCTGGPYAVQKEWGVFPDNFCPGRESTYEFLENVLDEALTLFPSRYIHIGGDEAVKDRWSSCTACQARMREHGLENVQQLQSYFIGRINTFLRSRGRILTGWDEILEGGLAPGAVVQSWRGTEGGIAAATAGHDVIMSPNTHCYIDHSHEALPLEKVYSYEPVPPELPSSRAKHVLGVEGTMWTEWVQNRTRANFQIYPRMTALAEIAWSPAAGRNYADFTRRMVAHTQRLAALGVVTGAPDDPTTSSAKLLASWPSEEADHQRNVGWDITSLVQGSTSLKVFIIPEAGGEVASIETLVLEENGKEIERDTPYGQFGRARGTAPTFVLAIRRHSPDVRYVLRPIISSDGQPGTRWNAYVRVR